jgi:ABC-2 type transport system ATP-binding protein
VRQQPVLEIGVVGSLDAAAQLLQQHPLVEKIDVRDGHLRATLAKDARDYSDLPTLLVQSGFKLTAFKEEELNLETAFMALTQGITA